MKILSLLPVLGHPRDSKRITMLLQSGFQVRVLAFERDYHSGRMPDCPVESLGMISHGKYLRRFIKLILVIPKIRKALKDSDAVYASGPDMALIALIAGIGLKKAIALEVGDIRDVQLNKGITGKIIRYFDRKLVNSCSLLVVISQGFKEVYYEKWLKTKTPILLIENKLEYVNAVEKIISQEPEAGFDTPLLNRPLRIGYFGLLRDEWSLQVLESLALAKPDDIEIVLAGYPTHPILDLPDRIKKYKNIRFLGQYKSPQDLPALYNQVDMAWVCYPFIGENDWNFKWGRPNRFFESCFFKKPVFVRGGCHCANDVELYKIGKIIEDYDVSKVVNIILNIKYQDLQQWQENMTKLPGKIYMYTTEAEELKSYMIKIIKEKH